jgi:hypothetical protein
VHHHQQQLLHVICQLLLLLLTGRSCDDLKRRPAEDSPEWLLALQRLLLQFCCRCATLLLRQRPPVLRQMHCCRCRCVLVLPLLLLLLCLQVLVNPL